ncbi:DUF3147 family protein [Leptospira ilyithenensis]|uniref:DUF3147 family protein n=1 Tax=Leptospira ilyithenensis TaxID=2484901 RepID=A0A4R9LRB7_9LEPT|nr:DUF3147 family protein [Leptospira ilyithenensis]TGN13347.1 DUF3147 family protein [Leptospira ilyithenensis]
MNSYFYLIVKYLITAVLVVIISEVAKRSDRFGALVGSLPLITLLTLVWLYMEKQSPEKISNHAFYTFWYVLPTLPMFLAFPKIYHKFGFIIAMVSSILITILCFIVTSQLLKKFNIHMY